MRKEFEAKSVSQNKKKTFNEHSGKLIRAYHRK